VLVSSFDLFSLFVILMKQEKIDDLYNRKVAEDEIDSKETNHEIEMKEL
jgi:hypothetical protein